jgi:hypothetical protein
LPKIFCFSKSRKEKRAAIDYDNKRALLFKIKKKGKTLN